MKTIIINGQVQITSETNREAFRLLEIALGSVQVQESPVEVKGRNQWKGKHKVQCPHCKFSGKNIKLHTFKKHPIVYQDAYVQRPTLAALYA